MQKKEFTIARKLIPAITEDHWDGLSPHEKEQLHLWIGARAEEHVPGFWRYSEENFPGFCDVTKTESDCCTAQFIY